MWFVAFFGEEKPFPGKKSPFQCIKQISIVARWRYDWCTNAQENFSKSEKMCAKFVRTTSAIKK